MGFRDVIESRILVGDGAIGTLLYQDGMEGCFEEYNVTAPDQIRAVHQQYIDAGADLIQTNTYAANSLKLSRYRLEQQTEAINRQAVRIAKEVAPEDVFVFATIGGIGNAFQNEFDVDEMRQSLEEQASTLLNEDVDGFLLETFYDLEELTLLIEFLRERTDKPIIAQVSMGDIGVLQGGVKLEDGLKQIEKAGADVAGVNCRMGPHHMLQSLEEVPLLDHAHLSVYPNASLPNVRDGRFFYQSNPAYFKEMTKPLVGEGVRLIGGCCGTTPEHVRSVREAVDVAGLTPITEKNVQKRQGQPVAMDAAPRQDEPIPEITKTRTSVIVELDPPKSLSLIPSFMEGAEVLAKAGADAVTLADNSLASARIDNFSLGMRMKQETSARPLLHLACRDRNMIGLQSHLLGLHAAGIHDILTITGDPAKVGDFPGASSVFDMSSQHLMKLVNQLNEGVSFSGKDIGEKTSFSVAAAFNANARRLDREVLRLEKKIEAGADYFMSQPVYSPERFQEIYEATKHLPVPIFIGIMPLVSARNAEFLHHEVPGISLTDEVRDRMAAVAGDREASEREGLAMAKDLLDAAQEYFNGIYLITPFLRYQMTAELTAYALNKEYDNEMTVQ
ncbi:bifunctional homocysteine S-methyltransferase/methylenetetrahydrofolate reductase [Texcoconibacillus texcoconensis]|uniref:Homocysteine S-methyltransferase n=1 Tax=Texcoconibacillus texcoconensis TaxID=1095777 RepID=A0A840QM96_9BACI|nr:bifunctional homocysteine S-methyltransferase/methylenetetrahydrofolate reductase [Texcoconibacillus texcoconensis]MBB5172473.1 homocysteine S-methyltransferase [Texcoconibacillus texcoconensis]